MLVIAHRGSSGTAPENTMAAFRAAAEAGADMVELDVRLTRDGDLAVIHDRTLRRTTDGKGHVWETTTAQLRSLDAGSWYGTAFRGERVPLLVEVLTELPLQLGINIEVKMDGDPRKAMVEEVLPDVLARHGKGRDIIVSSFDHRLLQRLRLRHSGLTTGALHRAVVDRARKPSSFARRLGVKAFICSRSQLRKRSVDDAHAHSLIVAVYGVNTLSHLARVGRFGVDAVVTDFPERIIHALRRGK